MCQLKPERKHGDVMGKSTSIVLAANSGACLLKGSMCNQLWAPGMSKLLTMRTLSTLFLLGLPATWHTTASAQNAGAEQAAPFTNVLVLGSTLVAPAEIQNAVAPLVGLPANAALLKQIQATVTRLHDDAGFGLVRVDAPVFQGGVALIRVQALKLGRVDVALKQPQTTGNTLQALIVPAAPAAPDSLQAAASAAIPALQPGKTPNLTAVDQQLRLANLQPHRRWTVDFRSAEPAAPTPATSQPVQQAFTTQAGSTLAAATQVPVGVPPARLPGFFGGASTSLADIDVRVVASGTSPYYGRVIFDNAGQPATGRTRARLQVGHGDLLGPGRSVDITAVVAVANPSKQQQFALRLQNPVPEIATLLAVEASMARSRPGLTGGFFDVLGDSRSVSVSARHLLPRIGALEPFAELALDSTVNDDQLNFFGVNLGTKVGTTPLALTFGGTLQGSGWRAFAQGRVRHNLALGTAASDSDYAKARVGATPRWTSLDTLMEGRKGLAPGLEGVVRLQAQWSHNALISSQQFRVGGANLLRGLQEGELGGDTGAALGFEVWWAPALAHKLGLLLDTGKARRNQPQIGDIASASATSAALAWQWEAAPGVRLNTSAAKVLAANNLQISKKNSSRLHASLDWSF